MSDTPWFQATTIYQIYPRSYYDANGDGIGDIQGLIKKLDYIRDLGFETIWCSPFFVSPQRDFGYDISDYQRIAVEYGTLGDAAQLIDEVHRRGMRIVFDMVMNHTSDQHPWFKESRSSRDNPKADWYLWRDRPNNWRSYTRRRGWTYAPERGQYYWASFLPFQPDLNYRNPEVKQAMFETVRFWLLKGVDGFRLDMFNSLYKHADFLNNPFSRHLLPRETPPARFFQEARYNLNQPESFHFARELRSVCDEFGDKLLLGEVSGVRSVIRQFMGAERNDGLSLVFDFSMLSFKFTADYFRDLVRDIERHFPDPFMPVFVFSNHDGRRSIRRLGGSIDKAKLLHLLQLTVRGVPCMYYGEEIGMTDAHLPRAQALDPIPHEFAFVPDFVFDLKGITINRDEVRTPMQWNGSRNAGFSSAKEPWLPVNPDFLAVNVAKESAQADSLLNTIRGMLQIRRAEPALHSGSLQLIDGLPDGLLGYLRKSRSEEVAVFLNFTGHQIRLAPRGGQWNAIFKLSESDNLQEGAITLSPYSGIILKHLTPQNLERFLEKERMRTS
jgi:oligo-1,6-glucosidase/alpha-glucosidase